MEYLIGRDNLAATIHVPVRCDNNCSFCVNNKFYDVFKPNTIEVYNSCKEIAKTKIQEIVISGGEPMKDLFVLQVMLEMFKDKDVYINTSLIQDKFDDFAYIVNNHKCVKCINVSRHGTSFAEDELILTNIVPDREFKKITKPIRMNVLLRDTLNIPEIIDRWYPFDISLRKDFTKTTKKSLHTLEDIPVTLLQYPIKAITRCEVCHTTIFENEKQNILFHKGLKKTSVWNEKVDKNGDSNNYTKVNDIVVFPDGKIAYDWDIENEFDLRDFKQIYPAINSYVPKKTYKDCNINNIESCGSSGCGYAQYQRFDGTCGGSGFSC